MSRILIQIDSYPNTKDKITITKNAISAFKSLGYPILLTSHIEIPDELICLVDYHYSDGNNILLPDDGAVNFFNFYGENITMNFLVKNLESHSPSVITGWYNGIIFCMKNNFDYLLKLEYDFVPSTRGQEKLKNEIISNISKDGLVFTSGNHVSQKLIFGNVDFLFDKIYFRIKDWEDYYYQAKKINVPDDIRRIAPVFTHYLLKPYQNNIKRMEIDLDLYFGSRLPPGTKNNFPGFIAPLSDKNGTIFLCSYGMGWVNTNCTIKNQSEKYIFSNVISLCDGSWSFTQIEIEDEENYTLKSDIGEIFFNKKDILNNKFGYLEFK